MKVKPAKDSGNVVVELGSHDDQLLAKSPFKIKKILVPIDFSDCSKKALQYAVPFARQFSASITLIHVVQVNRFTGTDFGAVDLPLLEAGAVKSAEEQLASMARTDVPVPAATVVRSGHPVQEIVDAAGSLEADVIIISTHGRTGLKHVFLGSVAENIVRYAPCPVLVVREHEHEFIQN
jgi:universal stress protein A